MMDSKKIDTVINLAKELRETTQYRGIHEQCIEALKILEKEFHTAHLQEFLKSIETETIEVETPIPIYTIVFDVDNSGSGKEPTDGT